MAKGEIIEHEAYIRAIEKNKIIVDVLSKSACMSCQLKGVCNVSDLKEKSVEVINPENKEYKIGDKITVYIAQELGFKAVVLGYIFPLLLIVAVLIIMLLFTKNNELVSGLVALAVTIPYYLILYLFKDKLAKEYRFRIK